MQKINAHVSGVHCASCVGRIEKILGKQKGVQTVSVNLATEEARITLDPSQTSIGALSQAVEPMGYKLHAKEAPMNHGNHDTHAADGGTAITPKFLPVKSTHCEKKLSSPCRW